MTRATPVTQGMPPARAVAPGRWPGQWPARVLVPLAAVAVLLTMAVAAPWLAPLPPNAIPEDGLIRSLAPTLAHPFGTDSAGRDVLSRVLHGARVSSASPS